MNYDFDTPVNRRNTNSLKWDVAEGELPMWVADMDFPAAPEIRAAIEERAAHGVFGYSVIPDAWYQAYTGWWQRRNNSVTCVAPTKTFNLAGLQTAAVMVPDPVLRHKVWRALNTDEVAESNAFAVDAAVAAFTKGDAWLDELRQYVFENKKRVAEFVSENIPQIQVVPSEATYLLWLDCSALPGRAEELAEHIRRETGLYLSEGGQYGSGGEHFLRMNIACPRSTLEEGLTRLRVGVASYEAPREKGA